ncbi:unnamed protein product [Urochloa humidicola]
MIGAQEYVDKAIRFRKRLGLGGEEAWSVFSQGSIEEGFPAGRVFTRLKSSLQPLPVQRSPSVQEVEAALDALVFGPATETEDFIAASPTNEAAAGPPATATTTISAGGGKTGTPQSTHGSPAAATRSPNVDHVAGGPNGVTGASRGPEYATACYEIRPQDQQANDATMAVDITAGSTAQLAAHEDGTLAPGLDAYDEPPAASDVLRANDDGEAGQQPPRVDDLFTTPTAPLLQHRPVQELTPIEEVLKEYIKSIKGPLPDFVIAALSTLLDLDDEGNEQMAEALLQHAGEGVAQLQEEQEVLLQREA